MVTQQEIILKALQDARAHGVTNVQFNNDMHIFAYSQRIGELKRKGHIIRSVHIKKGLWRYYLEDGIKQAFDDMMGDPMHSDFIQKPLFETGNLKREN
jgi:hypothetical protein